MKETGTPRVLVAESDVIVALDLCVPLQEAGERVAGRLANVAATEALLEGERIELTVSSTLCSRTTTSRGPSGASPGAAFPSFCKRPAIARVRSRAASATRPVSRNPRSPEAS
jgi:hypothetical protein